MHQHQVERAWLEADWPAPASVSTLISTRRGGTSRNAFTSNNMAYHVGDDTKDVDANRRLLEMAAESASRIQWLHQVHGTRLIEATGEAVLEADGAITQRPGVACAVLTADCLPVLLCDRQGTAVAAVHAGWRGLAAGILVSAIRRFNVEPVDLLVYLGPAISQHHFEVGPEVAEGFIDSTVAQKLGRPYQEHVRTAFVPSSTEGRYKADLYKIARSQCAALGIAGVYGGTFCTYDDSERFYSYRRDGQTGRMASLIWLAR